MLVGKVVDKLWATRKHEQLHSLKFLLVDIESSEGRNITQRLVAVDNIGAGLGDRVLVTVGSSARVGLAKGNVPIDALIVGIIDLES